VGGGAEGYLSLIYHTKNRENKRMESESRGPKKDEENRKRKESLLQR
jgi:hypothetical protein